MKYKLINFVSKKETICDKVTIDGFDYYVNDFISDEVNGDLTKIPFEKLMLIAVASNNPNIDIPKVVCNIDLTKLCYYDRRNPDFSIKEEYGYDKEEVEATGNFAKKDCACDNCFYGRSQLTEQLIKSQKTHPFSEEDLISFAYFYFKEEFNSIMQDYKSTDEILQLWKEQQPKIVYYE